MQIARAPVVAETAPGAERVGEGRASERAQRGEAPEERAVRRDDPRDLRLLEHDLRDEHRVGIPRMTPRKVAAFAVVPAPERPPKGPPAVVLDVQFDPRYRKPKVLRAARPSVLFF